MSSAPMISGGLIDDAVRQTETLEELATRLFAALGYDGISLGEIAEAAGLDVAQVNNLSRRHLAHRTYLIAEPQKSNGRHRSIETGTSTEPS